ncbi:hypothetical protein [uncultured Tenacibaculum sp.]|uniref:hypothetical protein n=1 Tax=uncultured Tenacibaculum sp. TaxID=174713 RepID=UPI0026155335|nr:hypothetical protein [uncultured Tenacibaculum sp.]
MKTPIKLLSLATVLMITSCSTSEVPAEEGPTNPPLEKVTYEKDVKGIINSSCATTNCHDDVNPTAGLALTTYTRVRNAAETGNIFGRINNTASPMPPSGLLPSSTRNIISQWRADGYLEQ